ncbi:MAG: Synechococcus phage Bellamy, partial [Bacteroidota bacterium]
MSEKKVKFSSIVKNQLPSYVREEFPLVEEFLSQYYISLEEQGSALNILENLSEYVKIDNLTQLVETINLTSDVDFFDDTIYVTSTNGFPESYGLIQIDSEIITYTGITTNSFTSCIRGFSGVTSYQNSNKVDSLVFSESEIATHSSNTQVFNLSVLFLKEFFKKIKYQIVPGFENREFNSQVNQNIFIKQAKDFYSSKGTNQSFEILFRALYGEDIEVIKPRDYLLIPSDAQYRVTKDLVVKAIEGNPEELINRTLFQEQIGDFPAASGSITNVQKIQRNNQDYYILSLDYDYNKDIIVNGSIFGDFSICPTTRLITEVTSNASTLDVDSTVGFPSSGNLIVRHSDDTISTITYQSKSLNQFLDCSGLTRELPSNQLLESEVYAYGYSGIGTSKIVKVRITGVLSQLEKDELNYYYEEGDQILIKNPGIELKDLKSNQWILNVATTYIVKNISIQNISNYSYKIETFDSHNFVPGDQIKLISSDGIEKISTIFSIVNSTAFIFGNQGLIDVSKKYTIQKLLSKANLNELQNYTTNIQNVYTDKESIYVASHSLPTYLGQSLDPNYRSVTFSGNLNGEILTIPNHGFYTGDSVTYKSKDEFNKLNISEGIYFVKKIDQNQIKLARSRTNIFNNVFVTLIGTVTENILELTNFSGKSLRPQKLIRKISNPINDNQNYETTSGNTGILVNGVEILNYKSNDFLFYGPIEEISVTSEGNNYDVINPPVLTITDSNGSGASGYCEVEGVLERIEVINEGFDYLNTPTITITGGNGINAIASPNLITINHSINFNSSSSAGQVNLSTNLITFSEYHKFRNGEEVVYKTNGQSTIGGLSDNSSYFVSTVNEYSIKFYKSFSDAISKVNEIDLISYGSGNHTISSKYSKKVIGSVRVLNSGIHYKNRKTVATSSGINTSSNTITIKNHKYHSGEIISYSPESTPISGLTTANYYVTKIDDNTFKLSQVGIGSTNSDVYYKNKEYVNLTSSGSGRHIFNYPEIQIQVSGKIGVSTFSGQNFNAILRPIFRGKIKSVFIENGGVGYGSSEILNYNHQPNFKLENGSGALLKPVVLNGRITNVIILNSGENYNSIPDIKVIGSGNGASLVPTIIDGSIIDVKIVNQGFGYDSKNTSIQVISAGSDANFQFTSKKWTVNLFERLLENNQISDDDSVISKAIKSDFELEYTHLYAPRKLRQIVYGTKRVNGELIYVADLQVQNQVEVSSESHSPILGWAYDGNPIYGPYGYSSLTGGSIQIMKSGYSLNISTYRPDTSLYPEGFFVEDYVYQSNGDLDEHNGRFCVTPEYPNGIYAYFATINPISVDSNSSFKNYRRPQFPYFIGNTFKSRPIDYNFNSSSNQDEIDL